MSEYQLTQGIIELSDATIWDAAKLEWRLTEVYEAESLKKASVILIKREMKRCHHKWL